MHAKAANAVSLMFKVWLTLAGSLLLPMLICCQLIDCLLAALIQSG